MQVIQFSNRCIANRDDSGFQPVHNQCVRNAFEVSKPRFLGHQTTHGPLAITHGKNGTQRQVRRKTNRKAWNDELIGAHIRHKYAPMLGQNVHGLGKVPDIVSCGKTRDDIATRNLQKRLCNLATLRIKDQCLECWFLVCSMTMR